MQIQTADKQLKGTRQFLEEQAAEREQERDEYVKELDGLKDQIRDQDNKQSKYINRYKDVSLLYTIYINIK